MGNAIKPYYIIKLSEDSYLKYKEFFEKEGTLIYVGTDEFKDHPEIIEKNKEIKKIRQEKEELLTKLKME